MIGTAKVNLFPTLFSKRHVLDGRAFPVSVLAILFMWSLLLCEAHAKDTELPRRSFIGIAMQTVDHPNGQVQVERVIENSSAALSDLRRGDLITALDGTKISTPEELIAQLKPRRAGDTVQLEIWRDGTGLTKNLTLVGLPFEKAPDFKTAYEAVMVDGFKRRTIITQPKGSGRFPAVLFVGGIGCYSMESPFDETEVYRQLLSSLTREGFVTMRVEKSGMGDSQGPACESVDLDTEVSGYLEGLNALKLKPYVDPDRVFVIGHSIGGIVGPLVAAQAPVKGIVAMGTVGTTWFEYELINRRRQLKLSGLTPRAINLQMRLKQWCMHRLLIEAQPRSAILHEKPDCEAEMKIPTSDVYLQQIAAIDIAELWASLKTDVLLIYGSSDYLTSTDEHLEIQAVVNAETPGAATYVEVADLDHFMTRANSQSESFQRKRSGDDATFHEGLASIIEDWLKGSARVSSTGNRP